MEHKSFKDKFSAVQLLAYLSSSYLWQIENKQPLQGIANGFSIETVAAFTGLTVQQIKLLLEKYKDTQDKLES